MEIQSIIFYLLFSLLCIVFGDHNNCEWKKREDAPEVFWINMDKSRMRKVNMEKHLEEVGLRNFRVRGITPKEIYIPDDIETTWRTAQCKLQTSWEPPNKLELSFKYSSEWSSYLAYTSSLCGRGKKKNTAKELGCTISHLIAMMQAIYSPTAKSRYALIVEDDVQFPFDIDFQALTQSAPNGFGILQLFNSNEGSMESTWIRYTENPKYLWIQRHPVKYFDFWSTCAYLIDRVVMKEVIDAVIRQEKGWLNLKIVAGINSPCVPRECCVNNTDQFIVHPPCVWAPRGYQADSFLYAMTKTYAMSIPIIANGLGGNQSTFHQEHVEMFHRKAFRRQREYINMMLSGKVKPPDFMKPACNQLLDINLL
jgi:GR25 family glycosyltransferase involved in LPS biosynthesis